MAVVKGAASVKLDGEDVTAVDESGELLRVSVPLQVSWAKGGISVNGMMVRSLRVASPNVLYLNGKGYRDTIEISPMAKGLLVINDLPLEAYLIGIINCEISSQWAMEAVKAQAVVARTYAVYQREARKNLLYQLESTVMDQVYEGCAIEDSRAARGVRETAGEVLTYDGRVIQAFFHSSCGGHTEAAENVWSFGQPYLQGVDCKYCLVSPSSAWEAKLPLQKLAVLLRKGGYPVSGVRGIIPLGHTRSGRISVLSVICERGSVNIPAVEFRKTIGYGVIKSTSFEVRISGDAAVFSGAGYGHGVGLCQWGAKKRAEDGFSYREILSYYYPGTTLERLDDL